MPGCGEEEFLKVAGENGFAIVRMGDVVREDATRKRIGESDEAIGGFAHAEREKHGYGVWAERTLPRVTGDRVVIDGLRGSKELEAFRKGLGESGEVVAVHASPKVRYQRPRQRHRSETPPTGKGFAAPEPGEHPRGR